MAVSIETLRSQRFGEYYEHLYWGNEPKELTQCANMDCGGPVHGRHIVAIDCGNDTEHFCSVFCYREWEMFLAKMWWEHPFVEKLVNMRFRLKTRPGIKAPKEVCDLIDQHHEEAVEWERRSNEQLEKYYEADEKAGHYRREAITNGQTFDNLAVFARDNFTCHICGYEVRMKDTHPKPLAPVLDHVHPLVKGGTHTWENVACAHSYCNTVKRDRLVTERMREKCRIHVHELLSLRKLSARNSA